MPDGTMSKYLNKDLTAAIAMLRVSQGTAKETGNLYYFVELEFINGFKKRIFLKSDEQFAWCNAFDVLLNAEADDFAV